VIAARIARRREPGPFRYRYRGNLATIGRKAAVAEFGWIRLSGFPAWLRWALAHGHFLIG
jgi:NADH dehydrogenase